MKKNKSETSLDYAALAIVNAMDKLTRKNKKASWAKKYVFSLAVDELNSIVDVDDIPPGETYFFGHWQFISTRIATKYRKYIIPERGRGGGIRYGTFSEYQKINSSFIHPILKGLEKRSAVRTQICVSRGGQSMNFDVSTKLLTAGEKSA